MTRHRLYLSVGDTSDYVPADGLPELEMASTTDGDHFDFDADDETARMDEIVKTVLGDAHQDWYVSDTFTCGGDEANAEMAPSLGTDWCSRPGECNGEIVIGLAHNDDEDDENQDRLWIRADVVGGESAPEIVTQPM